MNAAKPPRVFLSYAWEPAPHPDWVAGLAAQLRAHGVDARYDRAEAGPGADLPVLMEGEIRDADFVLLVCTPAYAAKFDDRAGGVGYESRLLTAQRLGGDVDRFIPLLRAGEPQDALPYSFRGTYWLDFRGDPVAEDAYERLLSHLLGRSPKRAPLGTPPPPRPEAPSPFRLGPRPAPPPSSPAAPAITWLHLSDLHLRDAPEPLWHDVEAKLKDDLHKHVERLGSPDLMLLTGDLVFSGQPAEFEQLERRLTKIEGWLGAKPVRFAVPGNHDLARPTGRLAREFRILDSYDAGDDADVRALRTELWQDRQPEMFEAPFAAYRAWFDTHVAPGLAPHALHRSHFPGDASLIFEKDGFRLGLVGLNSAWAHYGGGDFDGRLQLRREQLHAALPNVDAPLSFFDPDTTHRSLLLMHHPPGWLTKPAREDYLSSIYEPSRFTAAIFGHMHDAQSSAWSKSGGLHRYEIQAPSLFGLEGYGTAHESRRFGYFFGRADRQGELRIWPRAWVRRGDGTSDFDHDPNFSNREPDGSVRIRPPDPEPVRPSPHSGPTNGSPDGPTPRTLAPDDGQLDALREHALRKYGRVRLIGVGAGDPVDLDEIYVALHLSAREAHRLDVDHDRGFPVAKAFELTRGRRAILAFGEPGSGKTTALTKLLFDVYRNGPAHVGLPADTVPVFLPLRDLTDAVMDANGEAPPLRTLLTSALTNLFGTPCPDLIDRLWSGPLLLLLDGLDEIADPDLRARVADCIDATVHGAQDRFFAVVSTRYSGYGEGVHLDPQRFLHVDLKPLDDDEVRAVVRKWYVTSRLGAARTPAERKQAEQDAETDATTLADHLLDTKGPHQRLGEVIRTPLLLTLLCIVAARDGEIPPRRADFFEAALKVLLHHWPKDKGRPLPWHWKYTLELLEPLARTLHDAEARELDRPDIIDLLEPLLATVNRKNRGHCDPVPLQDLLPWLETVAEVLTDYGSDRAGFRHLAFQEYLTARGLAPDPDAVRTQLAPRFEDEWWQEVTLLVASFAEPKTEAFTPLAEGLVQAKVPFEDHPQRWSYLLHDAHAPTPDPFLGLLEDDAIPEERKRLILDSFRLAPSEGLLDVAGRLAGTGGALAETAQALLHGAGLTFEPTPWTPGERVVEPKTGMRLLWVPGGTFEMGAEDLWDACKPPHQVQVSPFWLAETPVTNAQYRIFVEATDHRAPEAWDHRRFSQDTQPVTDVDWNDAMAFCRWLAEASGQAVALPTEAQWEFAARGEEGRKYPWGSDEPDATRAWYDDTADGLQPVGQLPAGAGPFGHLDLAGNVWEWCRDAWDAEVYAKRAKQKSVVDPILEGPPDAERVRRGGSFAYDSVRLRAAYRYGNAADYRSEYLGFRVCVSPPSTGGSGGGAP